MKKYRSLLFIPAHKAKYYESSLKYNPDCIILDLEDSVPIEQKKSAKDILEKGKKIINKDVFIRINSNSLDAAKKDIIDTIYKELSGFIISKVENGEFIKTLDRYLTLIENKYNIMRNRIKLIPFIETPLGVLNSFEISRSSSRIVGIGFGGEDYISLIRGENIKDTLLVPRTNLILSARANNIFVYDCIYKNINDLEGFRESALYSKKLGFDGKLIIHPSQINITNEIFGYNKAEIRRIKEIIEKFDEMKNNSESGIMVLNGVIIEEPHIKRYKYILNEYEKNNY
ncbi:putative Citrate lyase subunit beta [[Clostridium] ultunense Esp]|nr:putative Citrate lyase subunit beta [[Clostridium] ultunense Esp]